MSRSSTLRELFDATRSQPAEMREAFLRQACEDEQMRAEVASMLDALDRRPDFLQTPALSPDVVERALRDAEGGSVDPDFEEVGRYRVIRRIGSGGMGAVYEAEQRTPRRRVALKVLRTPLTTEQSVRRFEREARALGRLRHPGVAQIHDAGIVDTPHGRRGYLAMELVEGIRIDEHVASSGLDARAVAELLIQVCDALQHAHERGVVHRDVKSSNVLVDEREAVRVIDFGIALLDEEQNRNQALRQERPEQASTDADKRTDVYAVGALGYLLLAGRPPHDRSSLSAWEAGSAATRPAPAPLRRLVPEIHRDLEAIVSKAMASDQEGSYQSAEHLAADLRRFLRHETTRARPGSVGHRLARSLRRNRRAWSIATPVLLLVLIGAWAAWIGVSEERDRADSAELRASGVVEALEHILIGPDPRVLGRDAEAIDLLRRANRTLDDELGEHPRIAARLRHAMGETSLALGQLADARDLLERSLADRRLTLGPDHPDTLDTMEALGRTMVALGEYEDAEALARASLEGRRDRFGRGDPHTLESMHAVALVLEESGRYSEADVVLRDMRERAIASLGEDHPLSLTADNCLANLQSRRGDTEGALRLSERTLEARRRLLGERHPDVLQSMNNLAAICSASGAQPRAAALLERSDALAESTLGEEHPETLRIRANLAAVYRRLGREQDAFELATRVLAARERILGPRHPDTVVSLGNVAGLRLGRGEPTDAEALFARAIAAGSETLGPEHPTVGMLLLGQAHARIALGQYQAAEKALDRASAILVTAHGRDGPQFAACARARVALYEAWSRPEELARWQDELTRPAPMPEDG